VRCSSVPSSVAVIGVGMSLLGESTSVLDSLVWISSGAWVCSREFCGDGVGCCMGTWGIELALLSWVEPRGSFNSCVVMMRDSSGGQVGRPAMLSCSTGKTMASSSGVGMVR
jgi:hypothetical protein